MHRHRSPFDIPSAPERTAVHAGARELDTLLQLIAGTADQLDNIWSGDPRSEKYLGMLRASVGQAAAITAHLVAHAASSEPAPPVATAPTARRRQRILVADDERGALEMFERLFAVAGYEAVTVESGFECLDVFSQNADFDLVIVDYRMPLMDGAETFRRLRAISPEVPVLLSTAYIEQQRLDAMLANGLSAFLRKPLAPDELLDCVARLLGAPVASAEPRGIAAAV